MAMINRPPFSAPSPVGSNILPPQPQAPTPPPQPAAAPAQGPGPAASPPSGGQDLNQAQPSAQPQSGSDDSSGSINHFDAPIPGQSLTDKPGNAAWEHPPQFTDPSKAADMVWEQLMKPKNVEHLVLMLHKGVPAQAIAQTILFGGFQSGKWTPDVAMIIGKPVLAMIVGIGAQAGLDNMKITMPKKTDDPEDPMNIMAQAQVAEKQLKASQTPEERQNDFINGFLPRRTK